ncbi:unnamed protein product [Psylliodes chrysocephalus]|uniref:Uncharacterized protein n=1 Tax=Psylliodes chrysocephalus TaxID=3402493 RepID=A0A9P0GGH9_9CUCU|nr:unnamed protein product [Psylliodes chrysocephala]
MEAKKSKLRFNMITRYTREQKLVATVWYHERVYTDMSYKQLAANFRIRFDLKYPTLNTLQQWDRKLFKKGRIYKMHKPIKRLMQVPYVKASFVKFPNIAIKTRANLLGISWTTLISILNNDISPEEVELLKKKGEERANKNSGDTESMKVVEKNCSKNDSDNNINIETISD